MPEIGEIRGAAKLGRSGGASYRWSSCPECGKERWLQIIYSTMYELFEEG